MVLLTAVVVLCPILAETVVVVKCEVSAMEMMMRVKWKRERKKMWWVAQETLFLPETIFAVVKCDVLSLTELMMMGTTMMALKKK